MALIADDAKDRAEQLVMVTERLTALVVEDTRRIAAREPPMDGAEGEEKNRLANAYRLELTRIKHDRELIASAPPAVLSQLREKTAALHEALAEYEIQLGAMKIVTEGMVQAMAEEVVRQRGGDVGYNASGSVAAPTAPSSAILDRNA